MSEQDGMASQPYEDPGWRPAFKQLVVGHFSWRKATEGDGVLTIRALFLWLLMAPLLILYVMTLIDGPVGAPDVALGSVAVALGFAGIAAAYWTANRKLETRSAAALAESYRKLFFLGFALNEIPLLVSFALCFVENGLWPYLIALPFFLIGMALIAPSRRNFERRQAQIHAQGSVLSLGRALSSLPGQARS